MGLNNLDFKKFGIFAFLVYLLMLPVAIWKSGHFGRAISVMVMIAVLIWGAGKVSDLYYLKFRYRMLVDKEAKPILAQIENLKKDVASSEARLAQVNTEIDRTVNSKVEAVSKSINTYADTQKIAFDEIDKAVSLIREDERQALKEKIIHLKEDVKLHGKSIDSAEVRLQCEAVADKTYLLTEEERGRFYKDLEDIGFSLKKEEDRVVQIYGGGWNCATMDSVQMAPSGTGATITFVGDNYNNGGLRVRRS